MQRFLFLLAFVGGMGVWHGAYAAQVSLEGIVVAPPSPTCAIVQVDQVEQIACGDEQMWRRVVVGDRVGVTGNKDAHTGVLTIEHLKRSGHETTIPRQPVAVWQGTWLGTQGHRLRGPARAEFLVGDRLQMAQLGTDTILKHRFGLATLPDFASGDQVLVVAQRAADGWQARLIHNQTVEEDHGSATGVVEAVYLTPRPTLRLLVNSTERDVYYFDQTQFLRGNTQQNLQDLVLPGSRMVLRGRRLSSTELLATHVWLLPS
jgi:hypothetical protein